MSKAPVGAAATATDDTSKAEEKIQSLSIIHDIEDKKACPWKRFYRMTTVTPKSDPAVRRSSSNVVREVTEIDPYFSEYLQFLRWRGASDLVDELEMFVEMLTETVFWRYEAVYEANLSLRLSLCSGRDERFRELEVMLTVPQGYPEPGHRVEVTIIGGDSEPGFKLQAADTLQDFASGMAECGGPVLLALLTTAMEVVNDCPSVLKSLTRGMCPCCVRTMRQSKINPSPVPIQREEVGWSCMECGSRAYLIPNFLYIDYTTRLPILPETVTVFKHFFTPAECCSFCFDDEIFSLLSLSCGCWCCLPCLFTFCDIAVGERHFAQATFRTLHHLPYPGSKQSKERAEWFLTPQRTEGELKTIQAGEKEYPFESNEYKFGAGELFLGVGIPCPNHKKEVKELRNAAVTVDAEGNLVERTLTERLVSSPLDTYLVFSPCLFSLLPTRSMRLLHFFSMEYALKSVPGALICPLPNCKSVPFLSSHVGTHPYCPYCGYFFCLKCKETECKCGKGGALVTINVFSNPYLLKGFSALNASPPPKEPLEPSAPLCPSLFEPEMVTVAVVADFTLHLVELPMDGNWYRALMTAGKEAYFIHSYAESVLRREEIFLAVFQGALLDPTLSLRDQQVHERAIVFLVAVFDLDGSMNPVVEYLDKLGVQVITQSNTSEDQSKCCPICSKPVVHYINHGCHIIYSCHSSESDREWCYVCGSISTGHQCPKKCPLFCVTKTIVKEGGGFDVVTEGCNCTLCKTCKPMRPCSLCAGCPACDIRIRQ